MTPTRRKPTIRVPLPDHAPLQSRVGQGAVDSRCWEEWGIVDDEPAEGDEDVENSDDAVVMRVGNMMLIVTLFHGHIPDNEAEMTPKTTICGQRP